MSVTPFDGRRNNGENNRSKTKCPKGHTLFGENLLTADLKRGRRGCRSCHNERVKVYKRMIREARDD